MRVFVRGFHFSKSQYNVINYPSDPIFKYSLLILCRSIFRMEETDPRRITISLYSPALKEAPLNSLKPQGESSSTILTLVGRRGWSWTCHVKVHQHFLVLVLTRKRAG